MHGKFYALCICNNARCIYQNGLVMIASDTANEMFVICSTHFIDVYLTKSRKQMQKKEFASTLRTVVDFVCSNKIPKLKFCHGFTKELIALHLCWCELSFDVCFYFNDNQRLQCSFRIASTWRFAFDTTSANVYVLCGKEHRNREQGQRKKKEFG